jgi:hypothetical protein
LGPACRDQRMVGDLPGAGGGGRVAGGEQRADHLTAGQVPAAGVGDECPVPARRGDAVGRVPSTLLVGGAPIAVSAAVSRRAVTGGADWHRRDRSNRGLQHGQGERAGRGTRAAIAAAARSVREGPAGAGGGGGVGARGWSRCGSGPVDPRPAGTAGTAGTAGQFGGQVGRWRQARSGSRQRRDPVGHGACSDPAACGDGQPLVGGLSAQARGSQAWPGPHPVGPSGPKTRWASWEITAGGVEPGSGTPSRIAHDRTCPRLIGRS